MSSHHNRFVTARLFKNISCDIVLVAELQGHALRVESGVFQGLTGVLQDMTLGFPFLPNPVFLFVVQLLIHLCFDGRILRSPMLQQSPRHRLEDMKERDGHVRCSAQKRSNILNSAMRVFGLVDGKKNSHSVLLSSSVAGTVQSSILCPMNSLILGQLGQSELKERTRESIG